jgi:hypothetical protein
VDIVLLEIDSGKAWGVYEPRVSSRRSPRCGWCRGERVARAEAVDLDRDSAVFGFSPSETDRGIARGNIELAARFELGAHWHTRYELVDR